MEAVYRQARAVLEKAAAATNKDQKTAQISLLVELCAYRGDGPLVAEVVEGVAGYAADRSAKVRRAVVEFVDAVVAKSKLEITDACAATAFATCCVLAVDENEPVAGAALVCAAKLLHDGRFSSTMIDDASRERLRNAVDPANRQAATGTDVVQSDAHRDASLTAIVALLVRDASNDAKRPSKHTKADAAALASRAATGNIHALDAAADALGKQFAKCHRELVAAILTALEADSSYNRAACRALHAAEVERTTSSTGAVAAAANKLEAALRREKLGKEADDALQRAHDGQPFQREEPPQKKVRRDPRKRRERKLSIDYDEGGDDPMEVEEEALEMPPPAEPPKDDLTLSAQAAGRLVAGARGPRSAAAAVPDAHRAQLRESAAARCLKAPAEIVPGELRYETRDAIVSRLARGEACDNLNSVNGVLRRAVADKESRRDGLKLGLRVLFELYAREKRGASEDAYDRSLLVFLEALRDGLDAEERKLLAEALLGAPRLPDAAIAFLGDLCESANYVALGLGALRDVATQRPAARDLCLKRALELTRRPDVAPEVREKAVRLATNQLWPNPALQGTVVAFARSRLEKAAQEGPESTKGDDALAAARRELALVVALCVKDASLVPDVIRAASATADTPDDQMRATTRQACEAELPKLAPALATVHGALPTLEHAANALEGDMSPQRRDATEALLRSLVDALATGRGARAAQLWAGAVVLREKARQERGSTEEDDGIEFLTPALGAATGSEVEAALPSLLRRLDDKELGAAFRRAVQTTTARASKSTADLSACDLLVKLHHVKAGTVPLKRLNDALNVCLSLRDVFGPLALRDALDRMTPSQNSGAEGLASVPKAFLRTCILAVKTHPAQLAGPVAQRVLPRLVEVGVWKDADLWKGLLMYCKLLGAGAGSGDDACFSAALMLPAPQLQKLLAFAPKLKLPLKRHAEKLVKARDTDGVVPGCLKLLGL